MTSPDISYLAPAFGFVDTLVTVHGVNFGEDTELQCDFDGNVVNGTSISDTVALCVAPNAVGTVMVSVIVNDVRSVHSAIFSYGNGRYL
jgi:hypothetical protein